MRGDIEHDLGAGGGGHPSTSTKRLRISRTLGSLALPWIDDAGARVRRTRVRGLTERAEEVRRADLYVWPVEADESELLRAARHGASIVVVATPRMACAARCFPGPIVAVESPSRAFAQLADRWYGRPSRALSVLAVVGTRDPARLARRIATIVGAERSVRVLSEAASFASPLVLTRELAAAERLSEEIVVLSVDPRDEMALRSLEATTFSTLLFEPDERPLDAAAEALVLQLGFESRVLVESGRRGSEHVRLASAAPVLTFGLDARNDISGHTLCASDRESRLLVRSPVGSVELRPRGIGPDAALRSVAAHAGALALGVDADRAARAAEGLSVDETELQRLPVPGPSRVYATAATSPALLVEQLRALAAQVRRPKLQVLLALPEGDAGAREWARAAQAAGDVTILTASSERGCADRKTLERAFVHLPKPGEALVEPSRRRAIHEALERSDGHLSLVVVGQAGGLAKDRDHVSAWYLDRLLSESAPQ